MASENFINECKNGANGNRLGTIIVDGIETPITESNNLKKFSIDSSCYVDGSIIGSVYITKLTGELISVPDNVELIEKTIQAQIGVKFDDTTTEYIEMGKYTIERPNDLKTANKCQITAYNDLINQINSKYITSIDYFSGIITVKDLYIDVCNQLGLTPKTIEFINNDIPITNNPFTNNETNRTVLQSIAKVACSFVTIDYETNEIDLSWLSDNEEPNYIFTKDDYSILEGGTIQYGPINSVTIKNSQIDDENVTESNQESIDLHGEHSVIISEDYILYNVDLRRQAITAILERLNGFKYVDSKITCYYGKPFLKIGNKIRIYITDTEYIDTYVLKHLFTYDGAFESTIESPALTEQEIKTKQDVSLGQALRDTQITVNKQKGEIESLTTSVDSVKDLAGNVYTIEQTNQLIQNAQTGLTNTFSEAGGNNIFRNTGLWYENDDKDKEENPFEFWEGKAVQGENNKSANGKTILLQSGTLKQDQEVSNGNYSVSFYYQKLIPLATATVTINGNTYNLDSEELKQFYTGQIDNETGAYIITPVEVNANHITIIFETDTDNSVELYDLMGNKGEVKLAYSQNQNETVTDTVNISKGITITSSKENVKFKANADGIRTLDDRNEVLTEFTEKGMTTNEANIKNEATIVGILRQRVEDQVWDSFIG